MSQEKHVWTWPIAGYLFLGGLGAGMIVIASVADFFFGFNAVFLPCAVGSLVALGLGSFLLIFELGRPTQFWRVFSRQKAILTFGAWMVVGLIVLDLLYFSFWFSWVPWSEALFLRDIVAILCLILGCGVLLYTGIELSSMKSRVFWSTPALPLVFASSGLLTGVAADYFLIAVWPYEGGFLAHPLAETAEFLLAQTLAQATLSILMLTLIAVTVVSVFVYVLIMRASSEGARLVAQRWLTGSYAWAFWGGFIGLGSIIPLILVGIGIEWLAVVAALGIIIGGLFLRFLVVYSDDRKELIGEDLYWRRLPGGDEAFLSRDW